MLHRDLPDGIVHRGDARFVGGQLAVFLEPPYAAAIHQSDVVVVVELEQPEAVGGEPVVVVAVNNDRVILADPRTAHERGELLLADDVASHLVLQLALPVETDRTRHVPLVVRLRIDVDLDDLDVGVVEVLPYPVGVDEYFRMGVASHIRSLSRCGGRSHAHHIDRYNTWHVRQDRPV